MSTEYLRWTDEMEKIKQSLINSKENHETFSDDIREIAKFKEFIFFVNIPVCVAGSSTTLDSYEMINTKSEPMIKYFDKLGYALVAWYGWGGSGWLAQTKQK